MASVGERMLPKKSISQTRVTYREVFYTIIVDGTLHPGDLKNRVEAFSKDAPSEPIQKNVNLLEIK